MNPTYNAMVGGYIRQRFAPLRHAAKILGRIAGVSPRTAEGWLRGDHVPSGEALINLMSECSDLADEFNRLVAERRAERTES